MLRAKDFKSHQRWNESGQPHHGLGWGWEKLLLLLTCIFFPGSCPAPGLGHRIGRSGAGNPWGQTAGDGKGHEAVACSNYSRRSKNSAGGSAKMDNLKTATQNPGEKNKNTIILVYGPFNKGHLQPQWAHPFGKEPPLLPAGFSPQKSPAWDVLSYSSCSGHGTLQGNTQGPHIPKFSWQPSAFKCHGQT